MTRSAAELRDATPEELSNLIAETRRSLLDMRFQNASGELEDTAGLRETRRELARALTIARERDLEAIDARPVPAVDATADDETGDTTEEASE